MTPAERPSATGRLDSAAITRLLEMGISQPRKPVDSLIDRLRSRDAKAWLDGVLTSGDLGVDAARELAGEGVALEALSRIKTRGKSLLAHAETETERLTGLVGYFFATASAVRNHGVVIASRPREELVAVLLDLAEAAPEPWDAMFAEAAERTAQAP